MTDALDYLAAVLDERFERYAFRRRRFVKAILQICSGQVGKHATVRDLAEVLCAELNESLRQFVQAFRIEVER